MLFSRDFMGEREGEKNSHSVYIFEVMNASLNEAGMRVKYSVGRKGSSLKFNKLHPLFGEQGLAEKKLYIRLGM